MLFTCDKKATKTLISVALVCNRINDVQNIGSPTRIRTWDLRINSLKSTKNTLTFATIPILNYVFWFLV